MTQELAYKLISHYEKSIKEIEKMHDVLSIKMYMSRKKILFGICNCASYLFDTQLYENDWVRSKCLPKTNDWDIFPYHLPTKELILASLRVRVNILKTFKD